MASYLSPSFQNMTIKIGGQKEDNPPFQTKIRRWITNAGNFIYLAELHEIKP